MADRVGARLVALEAKVAALEAKPDQAAAIASLTDAHTALMARVATLESAPSTSNPNPTFNIVTVTGRLVMEFDDTLGPNGVPVNAYTELQWKNKRNGKVYHQIVSHGRGSSGANQADAHDHLSIYSYEAGAANEREHAFNISVGNAAGKPIVGLWDGIQKEQRWTRIVQVPSGQFWQETIEEPGVTKWVKVAGPQDPHPFP